MRRLPFLTAAIAAALALAGPARADPPMWIVRDADSTIVLFGSVHVLPPGETWRTAALDDALAHADDLWFEIPLNEAGQAEVGRQVVARSLLPPGETLTRHLPDAIAARLQRTAVRLGLYGPGLERLRPWMAELTLSLAADIRAGGQTDNGVEHRIDATTPGSVPRLAMETVAAQVDALAGGPETDQIASLAETLRDLEEEPDNYQRTVAAWLAGDVVALDAEALEPMRRATPGVYDRVITQRNRRWVEIIRRRLAGSGHTVIVVGVGHLIGPGSVPALLRAEGVTVDGP